MRDAVVDPLSDVDRRARAGRGDPVFRKRDDRRVPAQHLKAVEVHVDRVGVLGQIDESPDLGFVQHREERRGVLEARRDGPPS